MHRNKVSSSSKASFLFRFCWWNGGGQVRNRLRTNPQLRKLISTKPDIFVYGEALTPSPQNLDIDGYICYLHGTKNLSPVNFRRGLAIFYLEKYRYSLTREYTCRNYDIVWMKLKTDNGFFFSVSFIPLVPTTHFL